MINTSRALKDLKAGRTLELAEVPASEGTRGRRATALKILDVQRFRAHAVVKGVKLSRSGSPHPAGKVHTVEVSGGEFLVAWDSATETASVVTSDNVQHADGTETPEA